MLRFAPLANIAFPGVHLFYDAIGQAGEIRAGEITGKLSDFH
jgi:hypothetical protein